MRALATARRLARLELRALAAIGLLLIGRRSGVGPEDIPIGYARAPLPLMLGFLFAAIVETIALAVLIPWPVVHLIILIVDLQGVEMVLALVASLIVRPHVASPDELRLRYGVYVDVRIPASMIVSVRAARRYNHNRMIEQSGSDLSLSVSSQTNIVVELSSPVRIVRPLGSVCEATRIRFYADDPRAALSAILELTAVRR